MDDMLETMRGLVEMARAERHKIIESAEPDIVRLAVAIAERVFNAHIALEPNTRPGNDALGDHASGRAARR